MDANRVRQMVALVHAHGAEVVFHRAIDVTPDLHEACAKLAAAGIDRVLTSGGAPTALEGAEVIAGLQRDFGQRIQILAGSGVRAGNVADLVRKTCVTQVHSSCKGHAGDSTTCGAGVSFAYLNGALARSFEVVDEYEVRRLVSAAR